MWSEFDSRRDEKITISSLFYWAEVDGQGKFVRSAPKNAKPSDYIRALHTLGYSFSMNEMNDRLYVNGSLFSDGLSALFMTELREHGYHNKTLAVEAMIAEGIE